MTATPTSAVARLRAPGLLASLRVHARISVPVALYAFALFTGFAASATVVFPTNEGSAYYVAVAHNLAAGRGLVIDSIWSYATPPLVLPRPAFELWQPLASLIAAGPMALLGGSFASAQLGGILLGACLAPLAWAITRDAAGSLGTPAERIDHLAAGAGVLLALIAPVLLAIAVPDSTLPFLVFGTLSCWLAARALAGGWRSAFALGVALGLCYLSRHEAVYIGAVFLVVAVSRRESAGNLLRRLAPVVVGGAIVVLPWLLRNVAVFGTPLPGQALDNAFLTANDQIFNYGAPPTLASFLAQGPAQIAGNVVSGTAHNAIDVMLLPLMPVSLIGLVGVAWFVRRRNRFGLSALWFLLVAGGLTLVVDSLVFPVASMWGTFLHAAGPLLVGLAVAAVVIGDRLVDAVRARRQWQRANAWLAPLALVLMAVPMSVLQLQALDGGRPSDARYTALAAAIAQQPEVVAATVRGAPPPVVITDHPIWLNATSGLSTLALPDQPPDVVLQLARDQGATLIVVDEGRGPYPVALLTGPLSACFVERALPADAPAGAALFAVAEACR